MQKEGLSLGATDQQHKCQEKDLSCQLSEGNHEHREQMCLKSLQDGEEHQPGNQLYNFKNNKQTKKRDLMILKGSLIIATVHFSGTNNSAQLLFFGTVLLNYNKVYSMQKYCNTAPPGSQGG